jgi:3',5'-cyclic AMP phosphodiesterase CpdA
MSAWINLRLLGRGYRFRQADQVLAALVAALRERAFDHLIFSGDATALGFKEEMAKAAELLGVGQQPTLPALAVPGNHDYCTPSDMQAGHFERYFAPWQNGVRIDDAIYPFAQRVGSIWLIAVCSSTANRWAWDASGAVDAAQLQRLEQLLSRLDRTGPRILVTHYPVLFASGKRVRRVRALRNLDDVVKVAQRGGIGLWLHGHCHHPFVTRPSDFAPFPVICAGSATQNGLWSYGEYTLRGQRLRVVKRAYDRTADQFVDTEAFDLELPSVLQVA